jgi:isoleucyl-tRNA synthetase
VKWLNPWGAERFRNMMKDRADWCISRQRFWGVPIYMFYCEEHGHEFFDEASYKKVRAIVEKEGGDAWFDPARGIDDFFAPFKTHLDFTGSRIVFVPLRLVSDIDEERGKTILADGVESFHKVQLLHD